MATLQGMQDDTGKFKDYAEPGGYPVFYVTRDDRVLCAECASACPEDVAACDVHWEGEPLTCDGCNAAIDSAYGVPSNG